MTDFFEKFRKFLSIFFFKNLNSSSFVHYFPPFIIYQIREKNSVFL